MQPIHLKKYTSPAFTLPHSNFQATPAIPTALEIEPAYSFEAADTRRTNQEAPVGTPLAANGRCCIYANFFRVVQQLGTRHHRSFAEDDKKNYRIPQLHATQFSYKMSRSEFTLSIMWNFTGFSRKLPFCDRVLHVVRKHVTPVWTRSFPITKEPKTLGEHLRKKRFSAGLRQSQAAQILGVSNRTLSLWETDRVYPAWTFQPRLTAYLGHDPFTNPALGSPRGNETSYVAFLSLDTPVTLGQKMKQNRLKLRKTRKQMALELGVSVKTLWGWKTDRWLPTAAYSKIGFLPP